MADPYTQVYDAIWTMLENEASFTDLVKPGNRVKFGTGSKRSPIKDSIMAADMPEVRVVASADFPHPLRTSSSSTVLKTFEIQISTGDQRLDKLLFPVQWAIYKAMLAWPTVFNALVWQGRSYAKLFRFMEGSTGVDEADLNRGIVGWATVWRCTIEMWFTTADLLDPIPYPTAAYFNEQTFPDNHRVYLFFEGDVEATINQGGIADYHKHNFMLRYNNAAWKSSEGVYVTPSGGPPVIRPLTTFWVEFSQMAVALVTPPFLDDRIWYMKYRDEFLYQEGNSDHEIAEFTIPVT